MPLYTALPWINVWALADGDGWTVVDTGVHSAAATGAWTTALGGALGGRPVSRVIVTHLHPDHCGLAGWLAERDAARLWMTRLEYLTGRLMAADTGHEPPRDGVEFYRSAGWDADALRRYAEKFGWFGQMIYPMPASYRRIVDGEMLTIGGRAWTVVVGTGHSPEHACLHCPELGLLISGDQVLPRITSNVSVYPIEPDADPLAEWQASIATLKARIGDDVLVLPAHNSPFYGLHARLDRLAAVHAQALDRLETLLAEPRRAVDVFGALFKRTIDSSVLGMATGEAIAHLNHLQKIGRATRERDAAGVWWWRRAR
ncbi:MAG: MBL fold metallo-hydrolase [Gammaproteobacteria bacterium]|nr:MBL fold metallo-hydrolase [Gammaproteobacteria bacterium]